MNPHAVKHWLLRPARLPIPPPPQSNEQYNPPSPTCQSEKKQGTRPKGRVPLNLVRGEGVEPSQLMQPTAPQTVASANSAILAYHALNKGELYYNEEIKKFKGYV